MGRKKIPKGRGEEKIGKGELNEIFQLEIGLVTVLVLIGFFSILSAVLPLDWVQFNIFGKDLYGHASKVCVDSDNGINALKKGTTNGIFNEIYTTKTDECMENTLNEYYCDILECPSCIYVRDINCPNECIEGACT
ncbi:hypothetical protein KY313_00115 [Candidatus Woesearchaeota archaeon]|jgi:hypothetical protein|nr:hypothetical protein [Candidatus Woesearchaeota archaeon]